MASAKKTTTKVNTTLRPYAESYAAQKCVTKKECLKIKHGDLVELKWEDTPNALYMVIGPAYNDLVNNVVGFLLPIHLDPQGRWIKNKISLDSHSNYVHRQQVVAIHKGVEFTVVGYVPKTLHERTGAVSVPA